ncbi:MAG TPA: type 4a pilus biogenesis protein PilO [Burkholderiaceae bacterium]|nr:type 4a pilus biogenesis protein PilO [Burkholderiaceae bacterium]HYA75926.1 type 4a pilus biogenesis protein PilO [Burkholderiaceae bacterium]
MANINDITAKFRGLTLENVGSWPMLPRMTLWGAVVVVCAALGYFAVWRGQMEELDDLRQQEVKLKEQYRVKLQQSINLDELRRQKEQVNQYVITLEKQLPSKAEMDALLSDINQAGIGRGLQFELFRPGQVNLREYYAELPISVKVSGRYHDLGAFASDIANLPRIVTLNNLNIQTTKDLTLTLDATAKTYRYFDEDEIAAQRRAREASKAGKK